MNDRTETISMLSTDIPHSTFDIQHLGEEPWSSGYERRLATEKLLVRIKVLDGM